MFTYPHTISNGSGEELTFHGRKSDDNGEYVEVSNRVKPGSGPPMHVHHLQDECLTVQEGKLGYQCLNGPEIFVGAGETVLFEKGTPHRFWNAGETDLLCTGWVRPPDNMEYFLTEIYRSTKENGGRKPKDIDAAFLLGRYKSEFGMNDIPGFVVAVIFPVLRTIGRITGRYRKYANAPEPVRR